MASTASVREDRGLRVARRGVFFVGLAIAMLVVVALGFGKSFYLRPAFSERPLAPYLVVHGITMTAWYLLFLAQALLVQRQRVDLHRRLGVAGIALALAVAVTGVVVHLEILPRMRATGRVASEADVAGALAFATAGFATLAAFVALVALAVAWRRRGAVHKRLMVWAFVWTLGPAFANTRPLGAFLDPLVSPHLPFFPVDVLWLAALIAFDVRTLGRVHPATWIPFVVLAAWFFVATPWIVGLDVVQPWLLAYASVDSG